jgi:hypothetical protein
MRIGLATAPLAFGLEWAGGGAVDNRNRRGLRLRNHKTCPDGHFYFLPPSAAHFSSMSVVTDLGRSRA